MLRYNTPEKKGISSQKIEEFIRKLEARHLSTHDVIIMRGEDIIFENYWAPFNKDFNHRMYSVTKSVLSLAIGFAIDEGYLSLDDKIRDLLPKEAELCRDCENMYELTVKNLLMMSTAKSPENWFAARHPDRVKFYFENKKTYSRPGGTTFEYDSPGSFLLAAILERLVGASLTDYLRPRLFDKIGVSKAAKCLKCPGGHSWGDSALICSARDLLLIGKFCINMGAWNGEQLISREYMEAATSKQIDNNTVDIEAFDTHGYGYLFWRTYDNSFFFNGMGCQLCICVPDKDIVFVYNGDNQGNAIAKHIIIDEFYDLIVRTAKDEALSENKDAEVSLSSYAKGLKLYAKKSCSGREFEEKINGKIFSLDENPMGISKLSFSFTQDVCSLNYRNAQGDKKLLFRIDENEFGIFPEEGYSKDVGSQYAEGNFYKCAASGAWTEPQKLHVKIQIIDEYFGILNMIFSFKDENTVGICMCKTAEDFLNTYQGFATGKV